MNPTQLLHFFLYHFKEAAFMTMDGVGAALFTWFQYLENARQSNGKDVPQKGSYLGPEYSDEDILSFLEQHHIPYQKINSTDLPEKIAELIIDEKVIGWFQGRMEFGPRALGSRSIIGDARSTKIQKLMNLKIKFRESFRPFAPSVLKERVFEYFEIDRGKRISAIYLYFVLIPPIYTKTWLSIQRIVLDRKRIKP